MRFYRQCRLMRDNTITVSWIPEGIARRGQTVRLKKTKRDGWEHWRVMEVGDARKDEGAVRDLEQQHKWTRPYSDM